VVDLHCETEVLQSYLAGVQVREISPRAVLATFIRERLGEAVLVAPDHGAQRRVSHLAEELGVEYVVLDKMRVSAEDVRVQLNGKDSQPDKLHVIVDDIISTGGTLRAAVDCLRKEGVGQVACVITHNVASKETMGGFAKREVPVYVTDSLTGGVTDMCLEGCLVEAVGARA